MTAVYGFYGDPQSVHSEAAVTWSLFGPLAYLPASVRSSYAAPLLSLTTGVEVFRTRSHVWLWRRLPHPDTLVPGGPEVDFGIQAAKTLLLGEAKWRSSVGTAKGVDGSRDQVQFRVEFCEKYGDRLYSGI